MPEFVAESRATVPLVLLFALRSSTFVTGAAPAYQWHPVRDSSDSATLPSAAKWESRLPYTIGSDPRRHRFVRWSDGSDSGSMGYVG